MRSRMMSAGGSVLAWSSASLPVPATRTTKPARLRYIPTKEAMLDSSSTTRMDCFAPATASYGGTRCGCAAAVGRLLPVEAIRSGVPGPGAPVLVGADREPSGGAPPDAVERERALDLPRGVDQAPAEDGLPAAAGLPR